jgi:hypothetical protein
VGDCRRGARGSNDPWVVLVDRFGCRSRQAARGPSRPQAKSLRITSMGLATRCESMRVAKKRRKPGPGGKAGRPVAGSQPNEHLCESGISREHIVDGRRSEPGKPLIFDGMAAEAVLVPRTRLGMTEYSRGATGSVRGIRCQPCPRSTTPWQRERRPEAVLGSVQK